MLATHDFRVMFPNTYQEGIRAIPDISKLPEGVICSGNVNIRSRLWASSPDITVMRNERDSSKEANLSLLEGAELKPYIPKILDKQLHRVSINFKDDIQYIVTPVESVGLMYEVYKRAKSDTPYGLKMGTMQSIGASFPYHGALMISTGGKFGFMSSSPSGMAISESTQLEEDVVVVRYNIKKMAVSSHMIALGLPPMTSFDSFARRMAYNTDQPIEYAVGFVNSKYYDFTSDTSVFFGRTSMARELLVGDFDLYMVMRCKDTKKLADYLDKNSFRIGGGEVTSTQIRITKTIPGAIWVYDRHHNYKEDLYKMGYEDSAEKDILDQAIYMNWANRHYSINCTGFCFLNPMQKRQGLQDNLMHAFAEPIYSIISIESEFRAEDAFWTHNTDDSCYFVKSVQPTAAEQIEVVNHPQLKPISIVGPVERGVTAHQFFERYVMPDFANQQDLELVSFSSYKFTSHGLFANVFGEQFIVGFSMHHVGDQWIVSFTPEWENLQATAKISLRVLTGSSCDAPHALAWREASLALKQLEAHKLKKVKQIFKTLAPETEIPMDDGSTIVFKRQSSPTFFVGTKDGVPIKGRYEEIDLDRFEDDLERAACA